MKCSYAAFGEQNKTFFRDRIKLIDEGTGFGLLSSCSQGMLLGKAGYKAVTRGNRNARVRGWIVYQRNTDEINANKTLLAKDGVTV
jgi:hypothetical protein